MFLASYANAGEIQQNPQQEIRKAGPTYPIDTLVKTDAGISDEETEFKNNLKGGFKNLFENASSVSGINSTQLNPQVISFVENYLQKQGSRLEKMKGWAKPYFDMMDLVLAQHGIPKELKYLAVIESHLKSYARSSAGAVGPWQFIASTARNMGLKVGKKVDERTDYLKSTHAAARYLTELYGIFNDWLLVVAAYNSGPGNVSNAVRRSGSDNFWKLQYQLPIETRNHVKKFIATHFYMEGQGSIVTLTKDEARNLVLNSSSSPLKINSFNEVSGNILSQPISGRYHSTVITKYITMDLVTFNKMNPDFDNTIANTGTYNLRLTADKMELFKANKFHILNESIQLLLNSANDIQPVPASKIIRTTK